jgi:glycosyltransferase involved in cell wall biosynthesis
MTLDLSICVPTLKAKTLLRDFLHSIDPNTRDHSFDITVAANESPDGGVEMLRDEFPAKRNIDDHNAGFADPTDQAQKVSHRQFAASSNDLVNRPAALDRWIQFCGCAPRIRRQLKTQSP